MFLPSTITIGLLTSAIASTVPSPATTTLPPRILVDTLLKKETTSGADEWKVSESCSWHTDTSMSASVHDCLLVCTTCDSNDTIISPLEEPVHIASKSTSSEMTSSEAITSQTISSESVTSPTSSNSPPPSTSSAAATSSSSSTTASISTSSQKPTSPTSASTSLIKPSLSTTISSSSSSNVPNHVTTTDPDGSNSSREAISTSNQSSIATGLTSQTSTDIETTNSSPAPTYSLGVPPSPPTDTSSLSTAAKAGIGAGAAAGLLLLLTAVALVLFKKRKTRDEPVQHNTWPVYDQPDEPAMAQQPPLRPTRSESLSQQSRGFWNRGGPRSNTDVENDEADPGVGGSEVPVGVMRGQDFGGGGGELDGYYCPGTRESWRSHQHHHHHHSHPLSEPARAPAGRYGASSAVSLGWRGRSESDQRHDLIPDEPRSPAGQPSDWHGSNVAWGAF